SDYHLPTSILSICATKQRRCLERERLATSRTQVEIHSVAYRLDQNPQDSRVKLPRGEGYRPCEFGRRIEQGCSRAYARTRGARTCIQEPPYRVRHPLS